jgi:hypothetical protein
MKTNETQEVPQSVPQYTETEIRSYLPTGWGLVGSRDGVWDPKKKVWKATVIDNVDFDYPVKVTADEMGKLGRLEALRVAIDKVFRERLG